MKAQEHAYSNGTLWDAIKRIADEPGAEYRHRRGKRYSLEAILVLFLLAALFGRIGGRPAASFYKNRPKLSEKMVKKLKLKHGIPGYSSFNRMMRFLDAGLLISELSEWIYSLLPEERKKMPHLAIDGKALRAAVNKNLSGKSLYIVNVVDVAMKVVIYQFRVGDKKNECSSIEDLITDILWDGVSIVSMDAMGTQKALLDLITGSDCKAYLPVKSNHKNLEDAIKECILGLVTKGARVQYGVDLGSFKEGDIASGVIENTRISYVEELNPDAGPYPDSDGEKPSDEEKAETAEEAEKTGKKSASEVDPTDAEAGDKNNAVSTDKTSSGSDASGESAVKAASFSGKTVTAQAAAIAAATARTSSSSKPSAPSTVKLDIKTLRFFPNQFGYRTTRPLPSELNRKKNKRLKWVRVGNYYMLMESTHGRYERREAILLNLTEDGTPEGKPLDIVKLLGKYAKGWENVKAIAVIRRYRAEKTRDPKTKEIYWEVTVNDVAYVLNTYDEVVHVLECTRSHWGVEVQHHSLDTVFNEDLHTARKGFAPENVSMITKLVQDLYRVIQNQDEATGKKVPTLKDIQDRFNDNPEVAIRLLFNKVRRMKEIDENAPEKDRKGGKNCSDRKKAV